jgi:methyl-accepting chemotaxis protein
MNSSMNKSTNDWLQQAWSSARSGRLQVIILTTLIGTASVLYTASWYSNKTSQALEKQVENSLKAMGTSKKDAVATWYSTVQGQLASQADNDSTATALLAFSAARKSLLSDLEMNGVRVSDEMTKEIKKNVSSFYKSVLIKNLSQVRPQDPGSAESYMHPDLEANILQYVYTTANPATVGNKYLLNAPSDVAQNTRLDDVDKNFRDAFSKTSFSKTIGAYHPLFNRVSKRFGLYDIFMVDTDGYVVYTVFKELDFQGNLINGPQRKTGLGLAFQEAMKPQKDPTQDAHLRFTSIEPYPISYDAPAAFLASALWKDGVKIGALVYQLPLDKVNSIMISSGLYVDAGLANTGESYLLNKDLVQQTDSRFLADLPSDKKRATITADGAILGATTVGTLKVESPVAQDVLRGSASSIKIYTNYRGKEVIGYGTRVDFADEPHVVVVEIEKSEALAAAIQQKKVAKLFAGGALGIFLVLSMYLGGLLFKPATAFLNYTKQSKDGQSKLSSDSPTNVHEEVGVQ